MEKALECLGTGLWLRTAPIHRWDFWAARACSEQKLQFELMF